MMALNGFDFVTPGIPPIAVHLESHMLWNRALTKGSDKRLAEATDGPFGGRRAEEPTP